MDRSSHGVMIIEEMPPNIPAAADPAGARKVGDALPAELRENGWTVARAAGPLSSRLLNAKDLLGSCCEGMM